MSNFWPTSKWVWAFIATSLTQAAVVLALEVYVFVKFQLDVDADPHANSQDPSTTIPTFLALYIFAFVYQLVLVWDALRMKNTIQIIGLVGLNVGLLIYGAVQVDQLHDAVNQLKSMNELNNPEIWDICKPMVIAIPAILAFFTFIMAYLAYKLYNEFAWTIYKHISADLRMKRRYLTYQIYIALLKFDFFFCLGFLIQFVIIVQGRNDAERWVTAAAIPFAIIVMFAAFWFCRRENLVGTIVVMVFYFGGLGYFCFKLVRMYQPSKQGPYLAARKELTTFAVLTIGLLLSTIIFGGMCATNYGRGLKPYIMHGSILGPDSTYRNTKAVVQPNRQGFEDSHGQAATYHQASYPMANETYQKPGVRPLAPTRMEID